MKLADYIKSLLPRFTKDRLTEEARITLGELETIALPSYKAAMDGIKQRTFSSKKIQDMEKTFKRNIKSSGRANVVEAIYDALETLLKNHKTVQGYVDKSFEEEVIISGVSVLKVNLIRLLELHSFCTRFSLKLLNYIYVLETAEVGANDRYVKDSLSAGEIKWIEDNYLTFCLALAVCTKNEKDLTDTINGIPDIVLADGAEAAIAAVGEDRADPFSTRMLGFTNNPIFHLRLIVAAFQANRYKEKKELKTVLELRLLNLQRNMDKNPDAALEKEIEYVQSRVDKLNHYLLEAEGA